MNSGYLEIETSPRLTSILDLIGMQRFSRLEGVQSVIWNLRRDCDRRSTWTRSRPDLRSEETIIHDDKTHWGKKLPKFKPEEHKEERETIVNMICLAYKLVGYQPVIYEDREFIDNARIGADMFIMWRLGEVIPPKKMQKILFGGTSDGKANHFIGTTKHDMQVKNALKQHRFRR